MDSKDEPEIDFKEIVRRVKERAAREITQPGEEPRAGSGWSGSSGLMQNHPYWPRMLESLMTVGPQAVFVYAALDTRRDAYQELREIVTRASERLASESNANVEALAKQITEEEHAALSAWMTHWKRNPPPWFLERAVEVTIHLTTLFIITPWAHVPFPPFEHPGFDLRLHDRAAAKKALDDAFDRHRDAYLDTLYRGIHNKKSTETLLKHYGWAARVIVIGETVSGVAKSEGETTENVREQVHKIEDDLGITSQLRPGRPRKEVPSK